MVDKCSCKIYRPRKNTVIKSLAPLEVNPNKLLDYFMRNIMLTKISKEITRRNLVTEEHIIRTEYQGRRLTSAEIYEVTFWMLGEQIITYILQYEQIVGFLGLYDQETVLWCHDRLRSFRLHSNSMDVEERKLRHRNQLTESVVILVTSPLPAPRIRLLEFRPSQNKIPLLLATSALLQMGVLRSVAKRSPLEPSFPETPSHA